MATLFYPGNISCYNTRIMKTRLRSLRKTLKLTQKEFAESLKISRNNIAGYESGTRNPSEAVISLICSTFHVNEDWLRFGTGEMFIVQDRRELLESFAESMEDYPNSFKARFLEAMGKLDDEDWEFLEKLALKLVSHSLSAADSTSYSDIHMVAESKPDIHQ